MVILRYHLVMTNIAMGHGPFMPIEIDGLPFLRMVDLSMAMLNNQMVHYLLSLQYRTLLGCFG
jgi:hypothetical protein